MSGTDLWMQAIIFSGLLLLGLGYFWKDRRTHLVRVPGFSLVGAFWGLRAARYLAENSDAVNITFTGLALPFFLYLAYHEWMSYKRNEELDSLRWAAGVTFLAGILYFSVDLIEAVASTLISVVAWQSLWLMQAFGYGGAWTVGPVAPVESQLGAPIIGSGITIILACTSFEAIAIFLGAVYATQMRADPWAGYKNAREGKVAKLRKYTPDQRKILGLLYTVPVIWMLNLVRNGGIIYLYNEGPLDGVAASFGMTGFDFAHVVLGKGLSFVALVAIAFVLFRTVPELLDNINGLLDLPRRGGRGKGGASEKRETPSKRPAGDLALAAVATEPSVPSVEAAKSEGAPLPD